LIVSKIVQIVANRCQTVR